MISLYTITRNPKPEWLEQAKNSAKGKFDEHIIVDDGSDIPLEGATMRLEPSGLAKARNTAISLCKGEIIACIDDDDYFITEEIDGLRKFIGQNEDADIYHFPCQMVGEMNGLWGHEFDLSKLADANQIPSSAWIRKSAWEKLGGYEFPEAEDWDFWQRAYRAGLKFAYYPRPIYVHRMRPDSYWGTGTERYRNFSKIKNQLFIKNYV